MSNKVYLVYLIHNDDECSFHEIRVASLSKEIAEAARLELKSAQERAKAEYKKLYGRDYDSDNANLVDIEDEEIWKQFYIFRAKNDLQYFVAEEVEEITLL